MKSLLYSSLVAVALLGTSCMKRYFPTEADNRLSFMPTPYQDKEVEVFFPGEYPADTAYVKIVILEQRREGTAVAYNTLVEDLKAKAKEQGMDAVLLLDKNQNTRLQREGILTEIVSEMISGKEVEAEYSSVTTHELAGVGIKFKKNLGYLPAYVQRKEVYALEGEREVLLASVEVDQLGVDKKVTASSSTDEQMYNRYVKQYDLHHLFEEKGPQWRYLQVGGQLRKRKLMGTTGQGPLKTVKIEYNEQLLPHKVELQIASLLQPEFIDITFNSQRQVAQKTIIKEGKPVLKEVNSYSQDGKLLNTLHYRVEEGKEQPFLKTVYQYYSILSLK